MDNDYISFNHYNDTNKDDNNNDTNDNIDNNNTNVDDDTASPVLVINNELRCYWMRPESMDGAPLVRLHNEMIDFVDYISLTSAEVESRSKCLNELSILIKELWPESTIHVYGSELLGFQTPSSDIDVAVLNVTSKKVLIFTTIT